MPRNVVTNEQRQQLQHSFQEIGPEQSMRILSDWLNTQQQSSTQYSSGEYREVFGNVVPTLRDAAEKLGNITD